LLTIFFILPRLIGIVVGGAFTDGIRPATGSD
jgi:hypothetical protein